MNDLDYIKLDNDTELNIIKHQLKKILEILIVLQIIMITAILYKL